MDDLAALARLIDAIRPWLVHLVFVGGWAHRLHRCHPLAHPPIHQPIRTRDADLALALDAAIEGNIREALHVAGFDEEFSGEHTPPVTQYRLGTEDEGFYAEFLVPLLGDGLKHDGKPDVTVSKGGITAQKLRHLELLLTGPWTVRVGLEMGIPLDKPVDVMVANPVSFITQKVLVQKHRKPDKRAQDVLYIHDTLELFGPSVAELRVTWIETVRPSMFPTTARRVEKEAGDMFREVTDITREAALIPKDRRLDPERLRAVCEFGLSEVLQSGP